MKGASKYKFHNILVADTKLFAPLGTGSSHQPDVLVLTNKLYKCQAHQINCDSCCLHVEQTEFRRRSLDSDPAGECFADCIRRRSVNVELNARAQISGKLVILAFSKIDHLFDSSGSPIRCQIQNTWPFAKFEPNSPTNVDPKQVSYSRLSSGQVPSMLIDSVDISWDPESHREMISLTLSPKFNNSRKHRQQVVLKETLLVSELDCYQPSVDTNQSISLFDESDLELSSQKVHLLTLINRQITAPQPSLPQADNADPVKLMQPPSKEPPKLVDIAPESYIDYPAAAAASTLVGRSIFTAAPALPTRAMRYDSPTSTTNRLTSTKPSNGLASGGVLHMEVPFLHNKYEFKMNESSQMGPSFFTEHDLTRIRLKPSGFFVLAISSGLVILTYTLCLIAYLRWRHKSRSKSRGNINKTDDGEAVVPIQRVELDISQPYNLQMPPATRTRLEMMLRRGLRTETIPTLPSSVPPSGSATTKINPESVSELRLAERRRRSRMLMSATNRDGFSSTSAENMRRHKQRQLNFGSINVVRAIRQAATLARSRLHLHSRYRPNLNVIPESDLEYLQSPKGDGMYRGLFGEHHNNLVYINPPHRARSEARFETLVEDAMRSDCSHYVDKLTSQSQATGTLFAKPIEDTKCSDAVSRSKILRQVKREDIFGSQDSERADI